MLEGGDDANLSLGCLTGTSFLGASFFEIFFFEESFLADFFFGDFFTGLFLAGLFFSFLSLAFAFADALFLGDSPLSFFIICTGEDACLAHVGSDGRCTTVRPSTHLSKAFAELLRAALVLYSALFDLLLKLAHLIVVIVVIVVGGRWCRVLNRQLRREVTDYGSRKDKH